MSQSESDQVQVFVAGGQRGRGRPRAAERKVPVTTFVPPAYYDRITKAAASRGEHVSEMLCGVLMKAFSDRSR